MRRRVPCLTVLLVPLVCAGSAFAHGGEAGGFVTGLVHPVSGLDHIAAMIAVGLWGAQLRQPAIWILPVMFPLVMALGAFLALVDLGLPGVEIGIALSAVALGAAVLLEARPPLAVATLVVSVFAVFHGQAHGTELPGDQDALVYSMGFVVSTGLLHATGIALGTVRHLAHGPAAVRGLGGVILAGGLAFVWTALK